MFLLYYFVQCGFISSNDSKPAILYETNSLTSNDSTLLPKTLLLMKFKEKLKHRKVTQVAIALSCREEWYLPRKLCLLLITSALPV